MRAGAAEPPIAELRPPWLLWLLPLAALPLLRRRRSALRQRLARVAAARPRPREALGWALRAWPCRWRWPRWSSRWPARTGPSTTVERVGKGAEIVLVLDRSRSMDQGFAGARRAAAAVRGTGPEALDYYVEPGADGCANRRARSRASCWPSSPPSGRTTASRMIVFSTLPMRVLEFTQKQRGDPGRHRRRQHRPRPVGDQHRPRAARPRWRSVRGPALHRLAHHACWCPTAATGSTPTRASASPRRRASTASRSTGSTCARRNSPGLHAGQAATRRRTSRPCPSTVLHRFFESLGHAVPRLRGRQRRGAAAGHRRRRTGSRTCRSPTSTRCRGATCRRWCYGVALACVLLLLAAERDGDPPMGLSHARASRRAWRWLLLALGRWPRRSTARAWRGSSAGTNAVIDAGQLTADAPRPMRRPQAALRAGRTRRPPAAPARRRCTATQRCSDDPRSAQAARYNSANLLMRQAIALRARRRSPARRSR